MAQGPRPAVVECLLSFHKPTQEGLTTAEGDKDGEKIYWPSHLKIPMASVNGILRRAYQRTNRIPDYAIIDAVLKLFTLLGASSSHLSQ